MAQSTAKAACLLPLLILVLSAQAQDTTLLTLEAESELWIEGTSNKSDWTAQAPVKHGHLNLVDSNPDGPTISVLSVVVASEEMVSQRSTIMDRLMHRALKTSKHKEIMYELRSSSISDQKPEDGGFALETTGDLTIAGITQQISMTVIGKKDENGGYLFRGACPLKMTDYGIKPPTAMFGALHTADDITVHFAARFLPAEVPVESGG